MKAYFLGAKRTSLNKIRRTLGQGISWILQWGFQQWWFRLIPDRKGCDWGHYWTNWWQNYILHFFKDVSLSFDFGSELLRSMDKFLLKLCLKIIIWTFPDLKGAVHFGNNIRFFSGKLDFLALLKLTIVLP